jgi:hypothetical protein
VVEVADTNPSSIVHVLVVQDIPVGSFSDVIAELNPAFGGIYYTKKFVLPVAARHQDQKADTGNRFFHFQAIGTGGMNACKVLIFLLFIGIEFDARLAQPSVLLVNSVASLFGLLPCLVVDSL